jgi:hypothetical protein
MSLNIPSSGVLLMCQEKSPEDGNTDRPGCKHRSSPLLMNQYNKVNGKAGLRRSSLWSIRIRLRLQGKEKEQALSHPDFRIPNL